VCKKILQSLNFLTYKTPNAFQGATSYITKPQAGASYNPLDYTSIKGLVIGSCMDM